MRVAIAYDCLFPNTVGGAERWYRQLASRLTDQGHQLTYLTRRQWPRGEPAGTPFETLAVSPAMDLYTESGRRKISEPLIYGAAIFWHLLRHGSRYDVVHMASFPYFSLVGAWLALRLRRRAKRPALVVDWFEIWTRGYWIAYLGPIGGRIGYLVQLACTRMPDRSFTFSRVHGERLGDASAQLLRGLYAPNGTPAETPAAEVDRERVVFAGRHIAEKRVDAIPGAIAHARQRRPGLRATILGDGPETAAVAAEIARLGLGEVVELHGRVGADEVDRLLAQSGCMLLPSEREGYGLIVVEAISHGTPAVVVSGPDNAATELIEPGVNGVVAESIDPEPLAAAILEALDGGERLRASTREWFESHRRELSIDSSLDTVERVYRGEGT